MTDIVGGAESARRRAARPVDIRSGTLQVRLAESDADIDAVQALRYRVFYDEMGAQPTPEMARRRRDFDEFDAHCDHLIAIDHALGEGPQPSSAPIATSAGRRRSFSAVSIPRPNTTSPTSSPFPARSWSSVAPASMPRARNHATLQMMWRGNAAYVFHHKIDLMFGCASLPGTDPDALAAPLSYLYQNRLAPRRRCARARCRNASSK